MEWHIDNFSCWNAEVHGQTISCPRVLSRLPSELHPQGPGGRLEARLIGGRGGDLFFLGPDGNPICSRLVNGDGEQPPGPTFEEVVARIKKIGRRDRLTLQFRCADRDLRKHYLRSVIDAYDATLEMDPKELMRGPQDVSCFDFPGNKKFKSFSVTFTDRFELTPSGGHQGSPKGFSFESKILVRSRLSILDRGGAVVSYDERERVYRDDTPWVFSDPIDMEDLAQRGLTLLLTLKVVPGSISRGLCHLPLSPVGVDTAPDPHQNSLSNNLMSLYHDQEFSDFNLVCGGVTFPTHKAILGGRSPVFKRLLLSDMAESKRGWVDIPDLDPQTLALFLEFLYTGSFADDSLVTVESALALYYAADKYQVPALKEECARILCAGVSVSSLCEVLSLADRHGDGLVASAARHFAADNYDEVVSSGEWRRFEEQDPALAWDTLAFCEERKG